VQTEIDPRDLIGHKAVDKNGDKIGTVDEVYLDDATGQPEWAAVRTGLFGRDAFVPLTTSEFVSDELRVPYEKALVKDSPDFGVGQHLSPAQELQLYRYYGLEVPTGTGQHAADPGFKAGERSAAPTPTAVTTTPPAAGEAAGLAGAAGAAAGMAAGTAAAGRERAETHEKPVEQTLTTPAAQPLPNGGRTSSFLTGTPPTAASQQPGTAGQAAAAAPAAAAMSAPSAPTVQTPAPAPFPTTGTGGTGMGAGAGTAGAAAPTTPATEAQRRPDPLTEPRPDLGAAPSAAVAKEPVPEPVEILCREERLDISTEWHVLGRARLRKYVTTEQVERRVPVVRERIRVERVPVSAEERANLTEAEITESVEEVTLHEERLIVKKTVVPVERIRLVTERITEEEVVREQLHREHIQVQDGGKHAGTPVTAPASATTPTPAANGGQPAGSQSPAAQSPAAQSPATPLRPAAQTAASRNPDLPGHALGV
jgi:uncharacterized protein (TIGR02271 family)